MANPSLQIVTFKAMGSPCQIRLYAQTLQKAQGIVEPAIKDIDRLEKKYSRYLKDSLLSKINNNNGQVVRVDEETTALLNYAQQAFLQSEGLFDITSGVLRTAWDFKAKKVPHQNQIDQVLPYVGWDKLQWKTPEIQLGQGMQIDFGGFVKEYAADAAAKICSDQGVNDGLVELGGDIRVIGAPDEDKPWVLGIRNPRAPENSITQINMTQGALATSGNYERFIMLGNRRFSHILNPKTGWPVITPAGVSVIAENCLIAGTVTTIAMLKGEKHCLDWLNSIGLPYCCVFNDGKIINTF